MKTILVFQYKEFYKQINYKTKAAAKKQLKIFQEKGMCSPETGKVIEGLTFELI